MVNDGEEDDICCSLLFLGAIEGERPLKRTTCYVLYAPAVGVFVPSIYLDVCVSVPCFSPDVWVHVCVFWVRVLRMYLLVA